MIPISDVNPTRRLPAMNLLLIAANVLVFFHELSLSRRSLDRFIFEWGLIPRDVLAALAHPFVPASQHAVETIFTAMFIHGGWLHILGNMLFLWIFGDNIEDVLGSVRYLFFYLVCGVAAALAQVFILAPFFGAGSLPNIGASGAIAGVLGAYLVLFPTVRVTVLFPILIILMPIGVPAFILIGWWFIQQFLYGLASLSPAAASPSGRTSAGSSPACS